MPEFYWIDSFAEGPFSGNPAGVCLLEVPAPDAWMRDLAAELGLSETAFALKKAEGLWNLRWFTPSKDEVKLCGHATLATAQALLESGQGPGSGELRFETLSGELRAWRRKDNGLIELDFPETQAEAREAPPALLPALGLKEALATARAGEDWLVEIGSEAGIRALTPDFSALKALGGRGVCVTAKALSPGVDFVSRFFGPALGINEDPVTGSAHCYLGPWWAARLGSRDLIGRQLSKRGGLLRISLQGGRAFLSGEAKVIVKGNCDGF